MYLIERRRCRRWLANLLRSSEGSATLEATMVFPVILLATFLLLFFAIYIGQQAIVYYETSIAGERAAAIWGNSAKDARTGSYPPGSYDGLYWRLGDDGLVGGLFGIASDGASAVRFGDREGAAAADADGGDDLAQKKLRAAAAAMSKSLSGEMAYENKLLIRRVRTEAASPAVPALIRRFTGKSSIAFRPAAVAVEPAEFIRSFDLVRYYAAKLKKFGGSDGGESFGDKAREALSGKR